MQTHPPPNPILLNIEIEDNEPIKLNSDEGVEGESDFVWYPDNMG